MCLMTSGLLKSSEVCTKLILKWFFNNEIKAYLGNCHVLQSTREHGNTNIEGINIAKSQSENSCRKYETKKSLAGFSSI